VIIASKLAQDVGEFGKIYATEAAARKAALTGTEPVMFVVAGVTVRAVVL
jgi:hypothetical protein